jgi:heterodisulfide reductase subunit A
MDIVSAVAQGQAAAGKILSRLHPGEKIILEAGAAVVNDAMCSGCRACLEVCCYKAVVYDPETHRVAVNMALCRGCGMCAAVCPAGAIQAPLFSDAQLTAEICGLTG